MERNEQIRPPGPASPPADPPPEKGAKEPVPSRVPRILSDALLRRMKRVDPTLARRYRQRDGE